MAVLDVERIEEWRGQDVFDPDGEKLGKLEEVYYEASSGDARFLSVKSGLLGRRSHLVPLAGASVGRDYVRVAFGSDKIQRAEVAESDGILQREAARSAASLFGVELTADAELESASLVAERRARVEQAVKRADDLDEEAHRHARDAKEARRRAEEAAGKAEDIDREAQAAHDAAVAARREADAARRAHERRPD